LQAAVLFKFKAGQRTSTAAWLERPNGVAITLEKTENMVRCARGIIAGAGRERQKAKERVAVRLGYDRKIPRGKSLYEWPRLDS
jgi:hypothetical protein